MVVIGIGQRELAFEDLIAPFGKNRGALVFQRGRETERLAEVLLVDPEHPPVFAVSIVALGEQPTMIARLEDLGPDPTER